MEKLRIVQGHRSSKATTGTQAQAGWLQKLWVRGLTAIYTDRLFNLLEPQFSYLLNGDSSSAFPAGLRYVKACVPSS